MANALGALLAAGAATARGDGRRAIRELELAERLLTGCDMHLHAAVGRVRRGALVGGSDGSRLTTAAVEWMREQNLREPERWAALIAPGV